MLTFSQKKYLNLLFYSFLTYLILGVIYPERFIFAEIRFTSSHTIGNFYQAALFHAKYIKNLDFTFWNFFDHSSLMKSYQVLVDLFPSFQKVYVGFH